MPEITFSRRRLVGWLCASAALPAITACGSGNAEARAFPISYSDAEWRRRLTADQYEILRRKGTERPGSSPLLSEKRRGTFVCAADNHPLYSSDTKFESGTGWPSFWQPLDKAVVEETDTAFGMRRTEVLCRRCGGHLGHVFDDGPKPTGLRYCMNGVAPNFKAA